MKLMIDEQGRQAKCSAAGGGILGAAAAITSVELCVKKYKSQGFMELEEFEKTEPPKIEERAGLPPRRQVLRHWRLGINGLTKSVG